MKNEELEKAAEEWANEKLENYSQRDFLAGARHVLDHFKGYAACKKCGEPPMCGGHVNRIELYCCIRAYEAHGDTLEAARLAWNALQTKEGT